MQWIFVKTSKTLENTVVKVKNQNEKVCKVTRIWKADVPNFPYWILQTTGTENWPLKLDKDFYEILVQFSLKRMQLKLKKVFVYFEIIQYIFFLFSIKQSKT